MILFSLILLDLEYQNNFTKEECEDWEIPVNAGFSEIDGRSALSITKSDPMEKNAFYTFKLKQFVSKTLRMSCFIKAINVSEPAQPYNGVKFMFCKKENGKSSCDNPLRLNGTFDFQYFFIDVAITNETEDLGYFTFGMQDSIGTVYFSNLKIESGIKFPQPELPPHFKAEYTRRVTKMPILRGMMAHSKWIKGDYTDLRDWNANLIRFPMHTDDDFGFSDPVAFKEWINDRIGKIDFALIENEPLGVQLIIDMHLTPGGRDTNDQQLLFYNKELHDLYVDCWRTIAIHFKNRSGIWAYDLMNEPHQMHLAEYDYLTIQYDAAKAIREIDDDVPIIVTSNKWSGISTFTYMSSLPLKNIIYQAHMYTPHEYTHQGVKTEMPAVLKKYPGVYDGIYYDRERIRKDFSHFVDFQKKYGTRMYIGEFSAVRWSPGAVLYLEDLIELFEEHGWDWSYHCFRGWSGWSVEHDENPKNEEKVRYDTDRKKVLIKYFSRNSFDELPDDVVALPSEQTPETNIIRKISKTVLAAIIAVIVLLVVSTIIVIIYCMKRKVAIHTSNDEIENI